MPHTSEQIALLKEVKEKPLKLSPHTLWRLDSSDVWRIADGTPAPAAARGSDDCVFTWHNAGPSSGYWVPTNNCNTGHHCDPPTNNDPMPEGLQVTKPCIP